MPKLKPAIFLALVCISLLLAPFGLMAQTPKGLMPQDPETLAQIKAWNAQCLQCHVGDSLHELDKGLFSIPQETAQGIRTSPTFVASNHGRMACKTCHAGAFSQYPHEAVNGNMDARTLPCDECHAVESFRVEDQVSRSVHSKNLADSFNCSTCHDPHTVASASRLGSVQKLVAQDNGMCLDCHNNDQKFAEFGGKLTPEKPRPDLDKIHDWLPNTQRHWESARCVDCHTPPVSQTSVVSLSHEILDKEKARKDCATCHSQNSALNLSLYRHVRETETRERGFANAAFLSNAYVIGATRNIYLDMLGLIMVGGTLVGVTVHGLLRIIVARRRKS